MKDGEDEHELHMINLKNFRYFFFNWAPRCTSFEKDILIHMDWEKPCITFHQALLSDESDNYDKFQ